MARFAEPVFCSTLLPFFSQPSDANPLQGDLIAGHDGRDLVQGVETSLEKATEDTSTLGDLPPGTASECPVSTFQATSTSERQSRSQCDDAFPNEEIRRRRARRDGDTPNGLYQPETRIGPLIRSRTISHQPSCDSLRNFSTTTGSLQSSAPLEASHVVSYLEQASLSEDSFLLRENVAQYTVMVDMDEEAWPVDDPRHSADVLESINAWSRETLDFTVTAALAKRASAHKSALPAFNRQEADESGVDMQGIHWPCHGGSVIQHIARRTGIHGSEMGFLQTDLEPHYTFHAYNGKTRPKHSHHQLRHALASVDRDVYYTTPNKVMRASLACPSMEETVLDLTKSKSTWAPIRITCLAATDSAVLIAGGFDGEYAIRNLDSPAPHSEGYVTHETNGVVTHVHSFFDRRCGLPQAAFCVNDRSLRLMDVGTETFTKTFSYGYSLNSAVTSGDGRLRAIVGDSKDALVTNAETGETLVTLQRHDENIFSCDWSPDGRLLATGAEDGKIILWDARKWSEPLCVAWAALTCPRSLHFTSDSSKLISAEDRDVVSIFDARDQHQMTKQDLCFLGTIAGVTLINGGDEIVVANGDRSVGGLLSFRRLYDDAVCPADRGSTDAVEKRRWRAAQRKAHKRSDIVEEVEV